MPNFRSINECNCPHCNAIINSATGSRREDKPKHDDFTICSICAEICVWVMEDNKVALRKPTDKDLDDAKRDGSYETILKLQEFVKKRN